MATLSAFSSLCSICRVDGDSTHSSSSSSLSLRPLRFLRLQSYVGVANYRPKSSLLVKRLTELRSVAEEEALIPEAEQEQAEEPASTTAAEVPVSVQVSPSDVLTMFFQAEGTMNETAIPTVTKALEEKEGITNIHVQVLEGIATVELTKQTTVQATGVASSLVEAIQGSGFKLQTLNLSFEDEDDIN
ncbi:hypothetical protein RJ639_006580 [Escallonia herrerae]|uniref:HMA domain-containing protein n=1 Tax=Escallonia herrerae TaxID=1293975 RepID=A0AA88VYV3_9ASTE|nr:hypothetical protein RJ639_006580 [Escallonia herrerae]